MSRSIYRDLFFALSFHPHLSGNACKVFVIYVTRHGYEGAWPSLSSLERLTGLSRKTIIKAKQELQDAGLIEVHESAKKSDLVFIPLLVENFHQAEPVESLPQTGVETPPEVGLLNNQDPEELPSGGKITPACEHKRTTERMNFKTREYEIFCKACNTVVGIVRREKSRRSIM